MKDLLHLTRATLAKGVLAVVTLLGGGISAHANVYATDIKLNGSAQQTSTAAGNPIPISYILSDSATRGVTINVYSNAAIIRTFSVPTNVLATNGAGLSRGTNTVFWDGNDSTSNSVGVGLITVSVTASSAGHATWTLLTTNSINTGVSSGGYYTWAPRGITIDTDSNSLSYGRVFVGNAETGPNPGAVAGDHDAILMFNADGTAADDGAYGNGGYPIHDANLELPQKLRTGDDGRLYMNDLSSQQIVAFDKGLHTNEVVLSENNYFANPFVFDLENGVGWFSFDVTLANTTNGLIWLGESDAPGAGVWFWQIIDGIADPNDNTGTNSVVAGAGNALDLDASGGLMADTNSDVFVSQYVDAAGDVTNNRCMMFTNANGFVPATTASWVVGAGDNSFRDISDTTIDSREHPLYVACAMSGPKVSGLRVLSATNGATLAANLDAANSYFATAWDSVGNLYAASDSLHAWRVWSPPGTGNTATTLGAATVKTVDTLTILSITENAGQVNLSFTASSTNAPSNFTLLGSPDVAANYAPVSGYFFTNGNRIGLFTAVAPTNGAAQYYIIKR